MEWTAALLATLTAVCFHWLFLQHAGGLWRDEASLVQAATLPSWHDLWQALPHESGPVLAAALIRMWSAVGLGGTDFGLRVLGFGIGVLLTACLWIAGWAMGRRLPLLPLALLGVSALVIRYGDSLRAYGLGSGLGVLTLALVWRAVEKTTPARVALAALAAALSVQALYQNAFLVFAACCAGMTVCAGGRRWRQAFWILGIGLVAAISLLPYIPLVLRAQEWYALEKTGFKFYQCWRITAVATSFPFPGGQWLWIALCLLALWSAWRHLKQPGTPEGKLALFSAVALAVGLVGFLLFLVVSQLPTQPWYYMPLLFFATACLDGLLVLPRVWGRPALAGFAILAVALAWAFGPRYVKARQTNLDLAAARLTTEAGPGDYIIVHPWYCGVSFGRYYHGAAPWTTLPPLADHTYHRYDLLKVQMQKVRPIQPVLDGIEATLKAGHRVWVVGKPDPKYVPAQEPNPAPDNPWGWFDTPYSRIWGAQTVIFIVTHARQIDDYPPLTMEFVNSDETEPVVFATGWKD